MGLYDRPYMQTGTGRTGGLGPLAGMTVGMPRPGEGIKWLLIINVAVFVVQVIFDLVLRVRLSEYFGVTLGAFWQVWRYVTFQFLHGGIWHIGLNMLGLYFLGMPLERMWGTRRFLKFYLSCGLTAGLAYVIAAASLGLDRSIPLIGASGGVFGVILAAAVYFPQFRILLFFFLPVPIRIAAVFIFGGMILFVLQSAQVGVYTNDFWSNVAHLGGTVCAAFWIWVMPRFAATASVGRNRIRAGAWQRKLKKLAEEQAEIDRILAKIRQEGIASLSPREKRTLQRATEKQRRRDDDMYGL